MNDERTCAQWIPRSASLMRDSIFANCGQPRTYRNHEIIFREGEVPSQLHFIISGSVKIFKSGLHRHEQILRIAGPAQLIGYRSLFAKENYSNSAEAREATSICSLDRGDFEELVRTHPDFALSLIQDLSREQRVLSEELLGRQDASAEERLFHCLKRYLSPHDAATWAPLKRVEMANLIGVAPETVSRLLSRLAEKQLIRMDGPNIEILAA